VRDDSGNATANGRERDTAMAELEILGVPQSSFTWSTRIALAEMGVPYTLVPLPPHAPEVVEGNPTGKIPAARHGAVRLGESRAILAYAEKVLGGRPLAPKDPLRAARSELWASILQTATDKAVIRDYVIPGYVFPGTPDKSPNQAAIEKSMPAVKAALAMVEKGLADGELGRDFTLAEAYLVPIAFYASTLPASREAVAALPHLSAWLAQALKRPSVAGSLPPRPS
jgi:glutathione S-transferase